MSCGKLMPTSDILVVPLYVGANVRLRLEMIQVKLKLHAKVPLFMDDSNDDNTHVITTQFCYADISPR